MKPINFTKTIRLLTSFIITIAILAGCAGKSRDTLLQEKFELMPQKYSQYDLKLAWDQKVTDDAVTIDGIVWNVRWNYAESLEVWITLIDPDGRVLAKDSDLILSKLSMQEKAHFSVKLKAKPLPGSKLLFTYRYIGIEDPDCCGQMMQSFESKL